MHTETGKTKSCSLSFDRAKLHQRALGAARIAFSLKYCGGLNTGSDEYLPKGFEEWWIKGFVDSWLRGFEEGREEQKIADARAMIAEGIEKSLVCRVLKLSPEELELLLANTSGQV